MVSSFVNACTAQTGVPVVGVSCAKGGSAIAKWLPGTPYYQDAVRRARKAHAFLQANGYTIRHSAMVWCQGCTDGDLHTPKDVYKADTERSRRRRNWPPNRATSCWSAVNSRPSPQKG